ncbi:hypothetical protein K1719_037823 [Acacia pycnantha]|nr:hypothetical protein K1719_037823 [Acacia pycnantha]
MDSERKGSVKHMAVSKEEEEKAMKKEEEEEEDENCRTPTDSENRIPEIQNCPPPPRKRRRSSSSPARRSSFTAHELPFFEDTNLHEVDSFFQSISVNEPFKLKRSRCTSV